MNLIKSMKKALILNFNIDDYNFFPSSIIYFKVKLINITLVFNVKFNIDSLVSHIFFNLI